MVLVVNGQTITVSDSILYVSGSVKQYAVSITFDETWDGYAKHAVFENLGTKVKVKADIVNGACYIPAAALIGEGFIRVGVYGTKGEGDTYYRRPTIYTDPIRLQEGCSEGLVVDDPDQTELEALEQRVTDLEDAVETLDEKVGNWVIATDEEVQAIIDDYE